MNPDGGRVAGLDGTTAQGRQRPLLEPTVSWPEQMTVGRGHLVEMDLALVTADGAPAPWPLEEEEYAYTCLLDGGGVFDQWAVHDISIVLHRFGGSYEPARFVVTPEKAGNHSLWLTIINTWGVPVGSYELPVRVREAHQERGNRGDGTPEPVELAVTEEEEVVQDAEVGLSTAPGFTPVPGDAGDGPGQDLQDEDRDEDAASLELGDQVTTDVPYRELPETEPDRDPADLAGGGAARPTVPDDGFPGENYPGGDDGLDLLSGVRPVPHAGPSLSGRRGGDRPPGRPAERLAEWYSLACLRRSPSGNLHWEMIPLFAPGAATGDRVTFTVSCAPSDEHGTAFALFAGPADGVGEPLRLASVQSARIPPGVYRVSAELRHPDRSPVRFHGLPVAPREDRRRWPDILGTVPSTLTEGTGPVHLIAAIEISGAPEVVQERTESVRRLVTRVSDEVDDLVCYSVITYGPHAIGLNRDFPEVPVTTRAWAESADDALRVLARLSRSPAAPLGYEGAAQLECVLTDLERSLTGNEGRPVIVPVGARPPHPPRVDPQTEIIPCRYGNDWAGPMNRLRSRFRGIVTRGIHDSGRRADELWRILGAGVGGPGDYFTPGFAASLGLTGSAASRAAVRIPVPLVTPAASAPLPGDD